MNIKSFIKSRVPVMVAFNLVPAGAIGLISALFWIMGDINYFWMGIIFAGLAITFTMILTIPFLALSYLWTIIKRELNARKSNQR